MSEANAIKQWADAYEFALTEAHGRILALETALRGGTTKDNADLLEWFADRLVNIYHEDPDYDYIQAARQRAKWMRDALRQAS